MKIYLAGRMAHMPDMNKKNFEKYAEKLRALNHYVFSPYELSIKEPDLKEIEYMGKDLAIISISDAVYVIPNWEASRGARFEVYFALMYGVPVFCVEKMTLISWADIELDIKIKIIKT